MIRVAIIGMGGIGHTHAGVYQNDPLAQLVAVCDMQPEKAKEAGARYGVPAYTDVDTLLTHEDIDAVSVTTAGAENGSAHFAPVMACLNAGKHVLCEKPISNNIEEARTMVATAAKRDLCFGINLNHRFVPPAARARAWIDEGRLGDLLLINMTMWIGNPNDSSPWFHLRALHPHSLDIMRYYCGDVVRVHAFANRAPGRVCYSNVQINLQFASGVVGHLCGSYDANPRHNLERCEVMGTGGRFVLENLYEQLTLYPRHHEELTVIRNSIMGGLSGFGATFTNRIHRWLEQLDEGTPPHAIDASGADGLAVQEVIEAAIRSIESGRAETVPTIEAVVP